MTWGEIGQLMSGTGVLITSVCAGVTVTIISLYQKRKQWVDDFRALYAEFWNDKDISQLACCDLVSTKHTLISPQPFVAWQTERRRGLRPSARVGVVRAHRGSTPA